MDKSNLYGSKIKLPSLDSILFSTEEERQDAMLEKVRLVPPEQLHEFPNHPFEVREDEEMQKMVESVRLYGVLTPLIARPLPEGGFEMIAGHRRKRACELAGVETVPVIVREMDDDTAVILMVDSNCQRENVSAMEKARAYKMKLEAIKRKAGRPAKEEQLAVRENRGQLGHNLRGVKTRDLLAENTSDSARTVQRYIRLNELIPELQQMVEEKKLKFNPAVELSYLQPEEQRQFYEYIDSESRTPSLSQAQQLKAASREQALDADKLNTIMAAAPPSVPPRERQISIPLSKIERFFPSTATTEQIVAHIIRMLEARQKAHQRGLER